MRRLNNFLVLATLIVVFFACEEKKGIPVEGEVKSKMEGEIVTLEKLENQWVTIDTIEIAEDGSFEFRIEEDQPNFYRLNFFRRQVANLIVNGNEEKIIVNLDGNDPNGAVEIIGSKDSNYLANLLETLGFQSQQLQEINQQAIQARMSGNTDEVQELSQEYYDKVNRYQQETKEMIWNMLPSLAAYYSLEALDQDQNFSFYDSVAQELQKARPDHPTTKALMTRVNSVRRLTIGSEAPEISLQSPSGETVTLSSLRGNYVLIDFWAAWCRPCRAENPNVVRMYKEYQDKNFEILGVSLDRTKEAWVQAIKQDGLIWKHVSDLQYFNSEAAQTYQINAIPATYLIDPEGKIIAKNLRGPSLEAKLKEIFG
ncbi:MAG: redoxin domain-containing protein [Bacteroidota bacterium]